MALANRSIITLYEKSPYVFGNLFGSLAGIRKYVEEKRYSVFRERIRNLAKTQWYGYNELKNLQFAKFKRILNHAYENVPYYKNTFNKIGMHPDDIKNEKHIKQIPILCKDDIKKAYGSFIARNVRKKDIIRQGTSGTTGSPLTILMDKDTLIWEKVWIERHRLWSGYNNADWRGTFGGHRIVPLNRKKPPFWRYNLIGKQILFSTYHMTQKNLPFYINKLRKSKVNIIDGYPSTIYIFAKYLDSNNLFLPMKAVFTGAEPIFDYQRETIERVFKCKIFDHYGLTEKVVSGGECEAHEGRHVTMEGTFVEIEQFDKNNNYGEILGTSLVNYTMPLIRYRTGDMSKFIKGKCKCGRQLIRLSPVETKMEDIITTPEGKFISASNLTFAFKPLSSIQEAQVIQEDRKSIRIRIIKGKGYSRNDSRKLLDGLQQALGPSLKMEIEFTDVIERTKSGKFRFVISKIPFEV